MTQELLWRARRFVPLGVWLLVVAAAAWLYLDGGGAADAPGMAQVKEYRLSTTEVGRVASLEVAAGERVAAGQVIARMDTQMIEREMAVANARLLQLQAEVGASGVLLDFDNLQHIRNFQAEPVQVDTDLEAARAGETRDRAELAQVNTQIQRLRDLVERRLAKSDGVESLEIRRAALEDSVQSWPARIEALETRRKQSAERLAEWDQVKAPPQAASARAVQLKPAQLRILEQQQTLRLLSARLERAVLKAPAQSVVVAVLARPGDVLRPGDPVASMLEAGPRQVTAYLEERRGVRPAPGAVAMVRRRGGQREPLAARVESVTSAVTEFPARFWINRTLPRWGREVVVQLPAGVTLEPGEAVDVSFTAEPSPQRSLLTWWRKDRSTQP